MKRSARPTALWRPRRLVLIVALGIGAIGWTNASRANGDRHIPTPPFLQRVPPGATIGRLHIDRPTLIEGTGDIVLTGLIEVAAGATLRVLAQGDIVLAEGASLGGAGIVELVSRPAEQLASEEDGTHLLKAVHASGRSVTFVLSRAAQCRMTIYDVQGRLAHDTGLLRLGAGTQHMPCPTRLRSGLYLYRIVAEDELYSGKLAILR